MLSVYMHVASMLGNIFATMADPNFKWDRVGTRTCEGHFLLPINPPHLRITGVEWCPCESPCLEAKPG